MGVKSLGIDISDSHVTGVVLEQQRKNLLLSASLSLPVPEDAGLRSPFACCASSSTGRKGVCVWGLPLSMLSVRNLALPFNDVKKIAQALPFELEEQLLVPIDTLVTDFSVSKKIDTGNLIVTFSLDKNFLSGLLEDVQDLVDPEIVTPAMVPLVAQIVKQNRDQHNFLLVHADLHSSTMVLVLNGKAVFYRRLAYPEQMILHTPFYFADDQVVISDTVATEECIRLFSRLIEQSLDYYRAENKEDERPERVILTGPLAAVTRMSEVIHSVLGMPVEGVDFLSANAISCSDEMRHQWHGQQFDRALSLALQGFSRAEINFRKESFAIKRALFSSRKQLLGAISVAVALVVCLFGFLGYDYRQLQHKDRAAGEEMAAIFKKTFPGVTKVSDPFIEMQARLKSAQGPVSPIALLHGNKRVLGLLADISTRVPATVALRVSRLSIDRESVLLKGTTDTFNSVETIKSSLAASSKFKSVQIVSATADKDKKNGAIRFEVQLQLEGI